MTTELSTQQPKGLRARPTVDFKLIETIFSSLSLSLPSFMEAIGYESSSNWNKWKEDEKVPRTAWMAARTVEAENSVPCVKGSLLLLKVPATKTLAILTMLEALNVEYYDVTLKE